jgi:hypothetical protein
VTRSALLAVLSMLLVPAGASARDVVRCGSGRDRARVDAGDSVAGCERVTRVPAKRR